MVEVILRSEKVNNEIIIEVSSKDKALKEAREYVQKHLKREDSWHVFYNEEKPIGSASAIVLYDATNIGPLISYESRKEADGKYTFYTREEALAKRESYRAEAERLLDEKEKQLKEIGVKLDMVEHGIYYAGYCGYEVHIFVNVEGYCFTRPLPSALMWS